MRRRRDALLPWVGRNLDAPSIPIPSIQRPHLEHRANRPKAALSQQNGCSKGRLPHGISANSLSTLPAAEVPGAVLQGPRKAFVLGRKGLRAYLPFLKE